MTKLKENELVIFSTILTFAAAMIIVLSFIIPTISNAATYAYVNTSGTMVSIDADSSSMAMATAPNIALHSGVMIIGNSVITPVVIANQGQYVGYLYVDTSGEVIHVYANNSADAFSNSINIDSRSGIMLIDSLSDSQMVGDQVSSI